MKIRTVSIEGILCSKSITFSRSSIVENRETSVILVSKSGEVEGYCGTLVLFRVIKDVDLGFEHKKQRFGIEEAILAASAASLAAQLWLLLK